MANTRFYLAARYERQVEMIWAAKDLVEAGHIVTSDWILGKHEGTPKLDWAIEDLRNLRNTDCVIYFSDDIISRSRFVEWGIAIGLGLQLIIIGTNQETPFHMFARVERYKNWQEFKVICLEASASTISMEESTKSNSLDLTMLEQKSGTKPTIWTYPQPSSMDPQQSLSDFPS